MAMKFDKAKLEGAVSTIHEQLNRVVLDYAQSAYDVFNNIPDDNEQKVQFKEAMDAYQNTYNDFADEVNKMLQNFDNTFELEGALSKFVPQKVEARETRGNGKVIDTSRVLS